MIFDELWPAIPNADPGPFLSLPINLSFPLSDSNPHHIIHFVDCPVLWRSGHGFLRRRRHRHRRRRHFQLPVVIVENL